MAGSWSGAGGMRLMKVSSERLGTNLAFLDLKRHHNDGMELREIENRIMHNHSCAHCRKRSG